MAWLFGCQRRHLPELYFSQDQPPADRLLCLVLKRSEGPLPASLTVKEHPFCQQEFPGRNRHRGTRSVYHAPIVGKHYSGGSSILVFTHTGQTTAATPLDGPGTIMTARVDIATNLRHQHNGLVRQLRAPCDVAGIALFRIFFCRRCSCQRAT